MINPETFYKRLQEYGFTSYFGVPDSLLSNLCAYIDYHSTADKHVICANEGNAIGMACGYHLSTRKTAVVYMQNSGLGNAVNPLTSIADSDVYRIPLLLIIGWRGEPGTTDEPQHIKQGRITAGQLDLLGIPYKTIDSSTDINICLKWAADTLERTSSPTALIVRKNTFSAYQSQKKTTTQATLSREAVLDEILTLAGDASIISTTGKTSREVFELRSKRGEKQRDFLTVGGMGHTSSIALGVSLGSPKLKVVCIDGDGSTLMHMGSIPIIGSNTASNLIHVILNNSAHESVGGQPTVAGQMDFKSIAYGCGYKNFSRVSTCDELNSTWNKLNSQEGPSMIEVIITLGSRPDLGRPSTSPIQNKEAFIDWSVSASV